ncbi:hypothetical protein MOQ_001082 [Trypanosoma cruzi marinkellei]|uniref:Uncharacterized protein n=1 Tax=Trypanosoma cruzi marinkellei TaxID=85056 RepID=K2PCD0_TRYCR|nr:hypothetical protein MOQ_001082 [Trypanosoma cruzi marinkellei]
MIAMFLICLLSDGLKCKNGNTFFCIGGSSAMCERDANAFWCDDMVLPPSSGEGDTARCDCTAHNNSLLLMHVVEVGPSLTSVSGMKKIQHNDRYLYRVPIAPLMVSALINRTGSLITSNTTNSIFGARLFAPLRRSIGLDSPVLGKCTRNISSLNISYSFDNLVVSSSSLSLLGGTESIIPFKNDRFALQKHLPGLQRVFGQLLLRRSTELESNRGSCLNAHLVIVIAIVPGTQTAWINKKAEAIPTTLLDVHTYVKKTISLYLRRKPRYIRLLKNVWFVGIPIGFPVHQTFNFSTNLTLSQNTSDHVSDETKENSSTTVGDFPFNVCHPDVENLELCREMCQYYEKQVSQYQAANSGLQKAVKSIGGRVGQRSFLLLYRDHFNTESYFEKSNWKDCFQLSINGSSAMARNVASSLF